jgi:chromatin remodeling complex protein RSC6
MTFDPQTYQKYVEYSNQFIIDIVQLNECITHLNVPNTDQAIEDWIYSNCYYVIMSHLSGQFTDKIQHNLSLAYKRQDRSYIDYLSQHLNITFAPDQWDYQPVKIKLKIKNSSGGSNTMSTTSTSNSLMMPVQLARLLGLSPETQFKYVSQILRLIHKYIYDHQLQNRYDRQTFTPDEELERVLTPLSSQEVGYTYLTLANHLGLNAS